MTDLNTETDPSKLTDDQLLQILNGPDRPIDMQNQQQQQAPDLSQYSDADLARMGAGPIPDVGKLESFGRGAENALTLGYGPQINAAVKTGYVPFFHSPQTSTNYEIEKAKQQGENDKAWETHPWLYGSGIASTALPGAVGAAVAAPEAAGVAGAAEAAGDLGSWLGNSGNIGSLAAKGLTSLGQGQGRLTSAALNDAASIVGNPIVQGGIYGSATGDDTYDRLMNAGIGALSVPVSHGVTGLVGKAADYVGNKVLPDAVKPFVNFFSGGPTNADYAGDLADKLGISLPGAAVNPNMVTNIGTAFDPFKQVPKAANATLSELGGVISGLSQDADPEQAGNAIKNSVSNWLKDEQSPNGFRSQLNSFYAPTQELQNSTNKFEMNNLQNVVQNAKNTPAGRMTDIGPTLNLVSQGLETANNGGATFGDMLALKKSLDNVITYNAMPGTAQVSDTILGNLRKAVSDDMYAAASKFGGPDQLQALQTANQQAQKLYRLRDTILKGVGNPSVVPNAVGGKTGAQAYNNIISAASAKKPNTDFLGALKQVVSNQDPEAWNGVSQTYARNLAPNGNFSFKNFNKFYNQNLNKNGKDLIFGPLGDNGIRDKLDQVDSLGSIGANGVNLGDRLDNLGSLKTGLAQHTPAGIELAGILSEAALTGHIPIWSLGATGVAAGLGKMGSSNIAAPLTKAAATPAQKAFSQTLKNSNAAGMIGSQFAVHNAPLIKGAASYLGAKAVNDIPQSAWPYIAAGSQAILGNDADVPQRARGGSVKIDYGARAEALIRRVENEKKKQAQKTKPLLTVSDNNIAKALAIANQHA